MVGVQAMHQRVGHVGPPEKISAKSVCQWRFRARLGLRVGCLGVPQVFYYALKAVVYPMAPVFDMQVGLQPSHHATHSVMFCMQAS